MKLSISTLACPAWDLMTLLDRCAAAGIEGIDFRGIGPEIDITKLPAFDEHLDSTLHELRLRRLEMPCLNTSVTLVTPAPERWQMMLEEAQRYATLAGRTGTRYVRVFGGGVPREMTRDEGRNLAQRHLRQLVKVCRPHGCQPILETHDDWATSDEVLELVGDFAPDEVAVLWDLEHPYRKGEPPARTAERLGKHLRHTHFKDSVRSEGKNHPRLLGEGELPLTECIRVLKGLGYDGWNALETEKRWHPDAPDPEQSVPQYATFMRSHW